MALFAELPAAAAARRIGRPDLADLFETAAELNARRGEPEPMQPMRMLGERGYSIEGDA